MCTVRQLNLDIHAMINHISIHTTSSDDDRSR